MRLGRVRLVRLGADAGVLERGKRFSDHVIYSKQQRKYKACFNEQKKNQQ
jgi:hypothetical protein